MTITGLLFYLVFLYIRPQDWVPFFLGWPIDFVVYAFVIAASLLSGEFYFNIRNTFYQLFIAWVLIIFLSNLYNGHLYEAREWLYVYGRYFIIFVCFFSSVNSPFRIKLYVWATVVLLSILVCQNISLVQTGVGWAHQGLGWGTERRARWVGLWDGMGSYALIFVAAVPFLIWYAVYARTLRARIFYSFMAFWLFYGGYLTRARGALIAFMGIAAVFFLDKYRNIKAVLLIAALTICYFAFAPGRFTNFNDTSDSAAYRIVVWNNGYEMLAHWPILGVGRGEYQHHTFRLIAHNNFLQVAGETGLAGLFVWLSLLYMCFKGLIATLKVVGDDLKPIVRGLIYSLIGYQFSSFFVTTEFELLYIYIALAAAISTAFVPDLTFTRKDLRNVTLIAVAGLIFFRIIILIWWRVYG